MNPDGTMAQINTIIAFAEEHDLIVLCIDDIVQYRKFVEIINK